jgi:mannose/fructose-specific phosphotransferase system component IIA
MVDAVLRISGAPPEALLPLSNDGKSPEALKNALKEMLGEGPTIIFTDLPSGSCALTARVSCREDGNRVILFGVNLPVLLDFVFHRDLPLEELVPRLLDKGRGSLKSFPEFPDHADPSLPG